MNETESNPNAAPDNSAAQPQSAPAGETAALQKKIDELTRQVGELNDKYLRAVADYQTAHRRGLQNAVDARDQQTFDIARKIVTVLDHFDRALEVDKSKASVESLHTGVKMVRDEFLKTLEAFGVKRIAVNPGDEFDPRKHEALIHQPAPSIAKGHVAAQLQTGYSFNDKTVRPAGVSVAS